ncbi:anthranilate synthase component I family protein [Solitalea lacus]|uniref:anthranilate synthase component I family protein n=1 Tax=Solitalea lacus TaxID=2911172 RepID=UPI001EDB6A50|nr:anthranilate synthase component I family protein [Solitalea lacus]UKJ07473.1 anthranilate synthase component I family protein [Solitalea lacus]
MKTFKSDTTFKKLLADTATPVSIYLRLRDEFPNSLLLESSDYHTRENSMSFICCNPVSEVKIENGIYSETYPDGSSRKFTSANENIVERITQFCNCFEYEQSQFNFITNGLFGYFNYDAVEYFEDIKLKNTHAHEKQTPDLLYHVYQTVIAINHFKNELYIFNHRFKELETNISIDRIEYLIRHKDFPQYKFSSKNNETSNFSDEEFLEVLEKAQKNIFRGDVFQIVISRCFSQQFQGDEFNVYRALRSINPSPYLFYFDYGNFKLFGSSPEIQLGIKKGKATIHPIAGTFRRTGNDTADAELAEELKKDPKENAEHVMLVDLARNDLSRHCDHVKVDKFCEIQYYSHVIHMVSEVTGKLKDGTPGLKVVADTFPAGTLSGAPKYRAMQLIDEYEKGRRGFYSGAIGFLGFNGDFNHAIMIRTFLSKNNTLNYQAGAGLVADSILVNERQEVNNKLAALKKAIELAEEI